MGRTRLAASMPATASVFLNVWDIAKSVEFYEGLGFRVDQRHERDGVLAWADLSLGRVEVGLGNIRWNDEPSFRNWVATPLGAGFVLYLTVPDIAPFWDRARAIGATIEVPLEERSYGQVFTLNDPDGYTLTFLQEPTAKRAATSRPRAAKPKGAKPKAARARKPAKRPAKAKRPSRRR